MAPDTTPYRAHCADHSANVEAIKRLESDRKDHAGKLDTITSELTECVAQIREASACLRGFVKDFGRITDNYKAVNQHIEENRQKINTLEQKIPEKLIDFEKRIERKIEILFSILAVGVGLFELMVHFG
jgi:chromosome segregation ATPase